MDQHLLGLTGAEEEILRRSADSEITRRRIRQVVAWGSLFAVLLVLAGVGLRSWPMLLAVALLYVAITVWEKVSYGRAVLDYKSVIRKLRRRLEESEESRHR